MKALQHILLLAVTLISFSNYATHIVGGVINYEHLGDSTYAITLKLYRDCGGGTASYPNQIQINVRNSIGDEFTPSKDIILDFPGATVLDPFIDTCVINPGICVEEAIYRDTVNNLPGNTGYHLYYQICCRNLSITNVNTSGNNIEESFYTFIPPDTLSILSDSIIWQEDFNLANGTTIDSGNTAWSSTAPGAADLAEVSNGGFQAQDTDGDVIWTSDTIDISAHTDGVKVCFRVSNSGNMEANEDSIRFFYNLDNSGDIIFPNKGRRGGNFSGDVCTVLTGDTLILKSSIINDSNSEFYRLESVSVTEKDEQGAAIDSNSNPVFNNFPPIFICANEELVFDHSATDIDGDSLVYSLYAPYDGDEPQYVGDSIIFAPVVYEPGYAFDNPLGGTGMTIDPNTGELRVTPPNQGQFVVGVAVTEWRDTNLLSYTVRDFQFNVVVCPPIAEAGIIDSVRCNDSTAYFDSDITASSYRWDFGDPNTLADTALTQNTSYTYPDTGAYIVQLIVNHGTPCADTTLDTIHIAWLIPAFTANNPNCIGEPVSFTNNTTKSENVTIDFWNWDFDDGNTSPLQSPTHTFTASGTYSVSLSPVILVGPDTLCIDTIIQPISITDAPTSAAGVNQVICANVGEVTLSGSVTNATGGGWTTLGSGTFDDTTNLAATYTFSPADITAGTVNLVLTTTGNGSCNPVSDTVEITITPAPILIPEIDHTVCFGQANVTIQANPTGGSLPYTYAWNTGANTQSIMVGAGIYRVSVSDAAGCPASVDTIEVTAFASTIEANAGADINACIESLPIQLNGSVITAAGGRWFGGAGNFSPHIDSLDAIYTPTSAEITAGTVELYLRTLGNGTCLADTDSVSINITTLTATTDTVVPGCSTPNGSAIVTPADGTAPYSYLWGANTGNQTDSAATGLLIGNYFVTVTDANGCVLDTNVLLSNDQPDVDITDSTHVSCFGASTGTATVTPSNGSSPYTYLWDDPANQTDSTATNLKAGIHVVTVTDNINCKAITSVRIIQPTDTLIAAIIAQQNTNCFGDNNGAATAFVSNIGMGTPPYTYLWNDASNQTDSMAINLTAGTYRVTVTDDSLCTDTASITITQPDSLQAVISTATHLACNSDSNGTATVNAIGGTTPYSYLWNDGNNQTTLTATGLKAGSYRVTVTDDSLCTDTARVTIIEPALLTANISSSRDVSCFGDANGAAIVTPNGGTASYSYQWSTTPIQTDSTAIGLAAGNYQVTITDINSCTTTSAVAIDQPDSLIASIATQTNLDCNGDSNGTVTAQVMGGNTGFTYQWSTTPTQTNITATNLKAGNYTITITDDSLCSDTAQVIITEPNPITVNLSSPTYNGGFNISCINFSDGTINIAVNGGQGKEYTYNWNSTNGSGLNITDDDQNNLSVGEYFVTVTDSLGCTLSDSIELIEPTALNSSLNAFQYVGGNHVSCPTSTDGSITTTVSGSVPNYNYNWTTSNGSGLIANNQNQTNLSAGKYYVSITDANNCLLTDSITLLAPDSIEIDTLLSSFIGGDNVSCINATDGSINLSVTNGIPGYTYNWSTTNGSGLVATDEDQTQLSAGTYQVTVTDTNSCTNSTTIILTEPTAVTGNANSPTYTGGVNISCFNGNDGSIDLTPNGGHAGYTFNWATTDGSGLINTDEDQFNLSVGTYSVTITDTNNCQGITAITLTEPTPVTSNTTITSNYNGEDISCYSGSDGIANVTPSGGIPGYTYQWNDNANQTNAIANNLEAGTYLVTVTDANSCTTVDTITLTHPTRVMGDINATIYTGGVNISCFGLNDGAINLTPSGGVPGYTYNWTTADGSGVINTNKDQNALTVGTYQVTITDLNGCSGDTLITLLEPTPVASNTTVISNYNGEDISCYNGNDGIANVTPSGGVPGYTYQWNDNNNQTNAIANNLEAGTYLVTVTDTNSCTTVDTVTLTQPTRVMGDISATIYTGGVNISCFGFNDGVIDLTPSGGVPGYTYNWTTADGSGVINTNEDQSALTVGTYRVTITDLNGCSGDTLITLLEPTPVASSTAVISDYNGEDISCDNGNDGIASVTPSGGIPGYTYQWNDNNSQTTAIANNLEEGTYMVTVTDTNNCSIVDNVILTDPTPINTNITVTSNYNGEDISCPDSSDGSLMVNVSGGVPNYSYLWDDNNNQTNATATNLAQGTYQVIITDANGCKDSTDISISDPPPIIPSANVTSNYNGQDVSCKGSSNGVATVTANGGVGNYSYLWNDNANQTSANAFGLSAGTYEVTVTDGNGCPVVTNVTVTEPSEIIILTETYDVSCLGLSDGAATAEGTGGTPGYSYRWDANANNQTADSAFNLVVGTYTVTVTDINNCTSDTTVTVIGPTIVENIISKDDTICPNETATISTQASGGNGGFSYNWSHNLPDTSSHDITIAVTTTYTVQVTDRKGCLSQMDTVTVLVKNFDPDSITTSYGGDVCIGESTTISGAYFGNLGPYTYTWNQNIGNGPGPHTVTPTQTTTYVLTVNDFCTNEIKDSVTVQVNLYPIINPSEIKRSGCEPLSLTFADSAQNSNVTYLWEFGDGTSSTEATPNHTYESAGDYAVRLSITSAEGCITNSDANSSITVHPKPQPNCSATPTHTDIDNPVITFETDSFATYFWNFGDSLTLADTSIKGMPQYAYSDSGTYQVTVQVSNEFGCINTCETVVRIDPSYTIKVPNAFVPDPTGSSGGYYDVNSLTNDIFFPLTKHVTKYHLMIFNRWGEMVFETFDVKQGWDGYYRGQLCQQDIYVWKIDATFNTIKEVQLAGDLTLLR